MNAPLVSIVLIGFDDAERLPRAIDSVLNQTLHNFELIIVDDASTDATPGVVAEYQRRDPRIRSIRLATNSGGCSAPRNAGLEAATGNYVMFIDSDDEYERHACMNLLRAAQDWNADLVCGTAVRLISDSAERIRWRSELHCDRRLVNDLASCPDLLYDTIAVNKIYRRSFLNDHHIRFPEGVLFEDQPFTLMCFLRAQSIGVIPEDVYLWHVVRESGAGTSITQSRRELRNVRDRITVNRLMDGVIVSNDAILEAKQEKFLRHEAYLYLSTIADSDDDQAHELMAQFAPYVAEQSVTSFDAVRPLVRVALYGLLTDDLALLRSAMRYENWASVIDTQLVRESGRTFWHNAAGEQVLHRSPHYWLDVTSLRLLQIPFSQRRYLHLVRRIEVGRGGVEVEIATTDYANDLAGVEHAALCLSASQGRRWELRLERASELDGVITWRGSGYFTGGHRVHSGMHGSVGLVMKRAGSENVTAVRALDEVNIRVAHAESLWAGPDGIDISEGERRGLAWRATGRSSSVGSLLRRLRPPAGAVSSPDPLELPAGQKIVVVAMAPRAGVGPASPPSIDLDALISAVGNEMFVLVVHCAADPISVPTRMRGSARSISENQCTAILVQPDVVDVVIGDDNAVLSRARSQGIATIAFRPDRGALEYTLAPVDVPEVITSMVALISELDGNDRVGGVSS